ncbi:MAG: hypothetical protein GY767_22705 [Shimia sp.]|nr:hypothetical protein [Shimia sp.]
MISKTKRQQFQQGLKHDSFGAAVFAGCADGVRGNVKFGATSSPTTAAADVWPLATEYEFPADAGEPIGVYSSDAADAGVVVGLRVIDAADGLEKSVDVTLTAGVPVVIDMDICAINRMSVDGAKACVGTIYARGDNGTGTAFALIEPAHQQTQQCPYMVPADCWATTRRALVTINRAGNRDAAVGFSYLVREPGGVFRTLAQWGLQKEGSSVVDIDLSEGSPMIPPGSQIRFVFDPIDYEATASARYALWLYDKDYICPPQ